MPKWLQKILQMQFTVKEEVSMVRWKNKRSQKKMSIAIYDILSEN